MNMKKLVKAVRALLIGLIKSVIYKLVTINRVHYVQPTCEYQ